MPQQVAELDRLFQALSDPTRRAVVERLGDGPAATTELARPFAMALPSFLQHLDVLEKAGLVTSTKEGRVRTFRLTPEALQDAEDWMTSHAHALGAPPRPVRRIRPNPEGERVVTTKSITEHLIDPTLDLVLEREVDVPPHLVWAVWTTPEHVLKWFAPKPYETIECEIDLRPGGLFRTVMRSPEGEIMDNGVGCFLEVVENRRLVWTAALGPGFRPTDSDFPFTAIITMEPSGSGTKYRAVAVHGSKDLRDQHDEMGFHEGWGAALDQLVELVKGF